MFVEVDGFERGARRGGVGRELEAVVRARLFVAVGEVVAAVVVVVVAEVGLELVVGWL